MRRDEFAKRPNRPARQRELPAQSKWARVGADGRIIQVGIGLTAVADAPFAATKAEDTLKGAAPGEEMFRAAATAASSQSRPATDTHGPAEYKLAMVTEMTLRALRAALARAQG